MTLRNLALNYVSPIDSVWIDAISVLSFHSNQIQFNLIPEFHTV